MKGINKKALLNGLKQMAPQDKQELKQILRRILSPYEEATSTFLTIPGFGNSLFYAYDEKIVIESGNKKWTIDISDF